MSLKPNTLYQFLFHHFGKQHWWPIDREYHKKHKTDPRFEIIIGAILTQNTSWGNVEKALQNLKHHNMLTIENIVHITDNTLRRLIQPSGFFNQKTKRLKHISTYFFTTYDSNLTRFFKRDTQTIRQELLSQYGIGPETVDSILLYAGDHPVFVVDAYTKRICERLPFPLQKYDYTTIQQYFINELTKHYKGKEVVSVYKELHALLVEHAKTYCRKRPICMDCILQKICNYGLSQ